MSGTTHSYTAPFSFNLNVAWIAIIFFNFHNKILWGVLLINSLLVAIDFTVIVFMVVSIHHVIWVTCLRIGQRIIIRLNNIRNIIISIGFFILLLFFNLIILMMNITSHLLRVALLLLWVLLILCNQELLIIVAEWRRQNHIYFFVFLLWHLALKNNVAIPIRALRFCITKS